MVVVLSHVVIVSHRWIAVAHLLLERLPPELETVSTPEEPTTASDRVSRLPPDLTSGRHRARCPVRNVQIVKLGLNCAMDQDACHWLPVRRVHWQHDYREVVCFLLIAAREN